MSDTETDVVHEAIWRGILKGLARRPYEIINNTDELCEKSVPMMDFLVNLKYIADNDLCDAQIFESLVGINGWGGARITTRGLDFLRDDGGLSAQLGVVTVRLDADTLKALICTQIDKEDGEGEEKSAIKHAIQALPAESLKTLTSELVKSGLKNMPDLMHWLETAFLS
ncbi:hypothetical protein [Acetobacter sp. KSO5]|uniref:hypothetical protein n=1 Tax=Acetobacter sp. KSO5 TaxID=3373674 RepID=UPI00376EBDDA